MAIGWGLLRGHALEGLGATAASEWEERAQAVQRARASERIGTLSSAGCGGHSPDSLCLNFRA
jgi:hypothetical protein